MYYANGRVEEAIELMEYVVLVKQGKFEAGHPSRVASEKALAVVSQEVRRRKSQAAPSVRSSVAEVAITSAAISEQESNCQESVPSGRRNRSERSRPYHVSKADQPLRRSRRRGRG